MNEINLQNIDLNLLKSFKVLFEEKNVGKSAKRLNISQSAMSHSLARLRKTFDDQLFIRLPSGMEPTDKAKALSPKITFIINQVHTLFAEDELSTKTLSLTIKIASHDFIVTRYLRNLILAMKARAPLLKFELQRYSQHSFELLNENKIDLVIAAGLNVGKQFTSQPFKTEKLVCLLDKNHPAINEWQSEKIFDYEHIRLNLLDEKKDPVSMFAKRQGFDRKIGLSTDSLEVQPSLIPQSHLIAFLPESIAQKGAEEFNLCVLDCPFELPALAIKTFWHISKNDNIKHKWIREFFKDEKLV